MFNFRNRVDASQAILDRLASLEHKINLQQFSDESVAHRLLIDYLCSVIEYNQVKFWFQKPLEISSGIKQRIKRHIYEEQ